MKIVCPHCRREYEVPEDDARRNCDNRDAAVQPVAAMLPRPSSYLVLSIIGLVWSLLLFFPAAVLGVIALVFSSKVDSRYYSGDYQGARSASKTAFWCGLVSLFAPLPVIMLICAAMLLPALSSARGAARGIASSSNLKMIGLAIEQYASDYNGNLPNRVGGDGFELLRKGDYLDAHSWYVIPGDKVAGAGNDSAALTEGAVSYAFVGAGLILGDSLKTGWADVPIAFEKPWLIKDRDTINVLYMGGHVVGYLLKFKNCVEVVEYFRGQDKHPDAPVWQKLLANAGEIDRANGK